eukprot:10653343-Karenia_brevis.AAC.1
MPCSDVFVDAAALLTACFGLHPTMSIASQSEPNSVSICLAQFSFHLRTSLRSANNATLSPGVASQDQDP